MPPRNIKGYFTVMCFYPKTIRVLDVYRINCSDNSLATYIFKKTLRLLSMCWKLEALASMAQRLCRHHAYNKQRFTDTSAPVPNWPRIILNDCHLNDFSQSYSSSLGIQLRQTKSMPRTCSTDSQKPTQSMCVQRPQSTHRIARRIYSMSHTTQWHWTRRRVVAMTDSVTVRWHCLPFSF